MRTILVWNDPWRLADPAPGLAALGWEVVDDRRAAVDADAIVFHLPTLDPAALPDGRRPGQRWVAWSHESEVNYPIMGDPAFMAHFDLTMTHRRDADVWVPYLPPLDDLFAPPVAKTQAAPAVYIASNAQDRSGRDAYVAELMRHVAVDRYGRQPGFRRIEDDDGRPAKLRTIARYRFTLAFENSIAPDYVTEKFFEALVAGSVPIVLGAPNVAAFAPAPDAYLDVRDFADPAALAARMEALVADERAYAAMLAWKTRGVAPSLAALAAALAEDAWVRLARRLMAR